MRGGFGRKLRNDKEKDYKITQFDRNALKILFKYLRLHISTLFTALLAMGFVTISTLAGPYLSKIAVDNYILKGDLNGLNLVFILMILSYGLLWFSSYWQTYLSGLVGQKIVARIREDLYHHLQGLSIEFYKKRLTGDIMSRLTHDVNALSDLVSSGFIYLLNDILTLTGIVAIMLFLNVRLALVSFITIPFIFFVISILGKKMRDAYRGVREKLAELNADVEENLSGIRLVQALNREAVNTGKFKRLSWENFKANLKAVSYFALLFPTMSLSRVLGEALVITYGGWQVYNGNISLGVLVAFLGYVRHFFAPLADLSQVYNTYQAAAAALERIYNYLSIQPGIKVTEKPVIIEGDVRGRVSFKGVSFGYEEDLIIDDFNLEIDSNEVLALVGPTGAGKTTLVNLLTRLYEVNKGSISIDGIDLRNLAVNSLREIIAVVPQQVFLFDRSIRENIRYGKPDAADKEVERAARRVNAHEFITGLPEGYETRVGEGGVRLSGGQKQLISFARALIASPEILILDEATSSVDAYTEVLIQQALEGLLKDRTAIIIAHRFTTLKRADRIAVLQNGKIDGIGIHDELIEENVLYKELFKKQSGDVA